MEPGNLTKEAKEILVEALESISGKIRSIEVVRLVGFMEY